MKGLILKALFPWRESSKALFPWRGSIGLLLVLTAAQAQVVTPFSQRHQVNDRGNILLIGNTLMCASSDSSCDTSQMNSTNAHNAQSMIFINADRAAPAWPAGKNGSSAATLQLPSGAQVLFAGLYWGARANPNDATRNTIFVKPPGSNSYRSVTGSLLGTITTQGTSTAHPYSAFADLTSLVQASGSGTYWVGGITAATGNDGLGFYAGWSLVVVYRDPGEPLRHLVVYDGLATVSSGNNVTITPSGFLTPAVGAVQASLGAVAFEGDAGILGDQLILNGTALSDAQNPNNNFFNSSISRLGNRIRSKIPDYLNQMAVDVDLVDATGRIPNGATSATVQFTSSQDVYFPTVLTFAVDLYAPDLTTTFSKTVQDVNGGSVVVGDVLEYTISFTNTGGDGATNVVLRDPIPAHTAYVPGSLQVVTNASGAPTGSFTDTSGDDIAEYSASCPEVSGAPCVRFRLGAGANASNGGSVPPTQGASVRFRVQVQPSAAGQTIVNTASVSYNSQTLGTSFNQTASASVSTSVPTPPSLSKDFAPSAIPPNGASTLTLTLSNPNPTPATLTANLVDSLPAGLVVASPASASTTCPGGSVSATPGGTSITLSSGAQIPAGGACTVTVQVTGSTPGSYTNTLPQGALKTNLGENQNPATATLTVEGYTLSGSLYHDLEPDGLKGPSEDWSTGTTLYVNLVQGGSVVASATVNPGTGAFSFQGVPPGSYSLVVATSPGSTAPQAPSGWRFINPGNGERQIGVTGHLQGLDFGLFHGGVVQGQVFWDDGFQGGNPNNALQDGGELGVGGVTVTATDGNNTRTAPTDGHGFYRLYIPASWGQVTLFHPLRPATGWNDGNTPTQVADWNQATTPTSPGATLQLGPAPLLAGYTWVRNFGSVRDSRFYPDASGQTSSPGVYTFSHWYRPGTLGTVTLSPLAPSPRYTYQVRVDLDCNGSFGPGEDWASFPYTFTVGTAWPREADGGLRACALEVRALVPAGEPAGAMDIALVEARLTWAANPSVQEPDTLTDTLHVVGGEVRLEKRVRNISQNTPFATTAQGKPNEVLEYCIAYRNLGTQPVSNFVLSDPIPFFTEALTTVADYGNKAIQWTHGSATQHLTAQTGDDAGEIASGLVRVLVGTVGPGEMGEVCYRVRIR